MPTPVSTARQCLTPEAAHALDEAVSVARRRAHAQTTSFHAVSALLSLPNSALRDACARARNAAYSPKLQVKALELCLSVSLDRVASTSSSGSSPAQPDDPPISNSFMAAVKRSQANQRRQPENYHQHQNTNSSTSSSSISCVKVELRHLILSILDDPVVSRVFAEAGFRSSEIKLAILRPLPHLLRYPHPPPPPNNNSHSQSSNSVSSRRRRPVFPFSGLPDEDDNRSRIGEVLSKSRSPLLVGVSAYDALRIFINSLSDKQGHTTLPAELVELSSISIEENLHEFVTVDGDKGRLNLKFKEVADLCLGTGVVVNIGDLKMFVDDESLGGDSVSYAVAQLTRLMEVHRGRVRLIGATASYGSYLEFVTMFRTVEKDWDLQLLPITSLGAESRPRSSLMESFVPLGGFFSAPSDLKLPLISSYQCHLPRNRQYNANCEQQVYAVSEGGLTASVAGRQHASLPSWMQQMAPVNPMAPNKGSDMKYLSPVQTKDGEVHPLPIANLFPTIVGFESPDKKQNHSNNTNTSSNETSCIPIDVQETSQFSVPPNAKSESFSSEVWEKPSKDEDQESGSIKSSCSLSNSSVVEGSRASPTSSTSVTTDLGLGICSSPASNKENKPLNLNHVLEHATSGFSSSDVDLFNGKSSIHSAQSSFCSSPDKHGQFDPSDVKILCRALFERVGWQSEAISVISQRIAHCRSRSEHRSGTRQRNDVWFNFTGPDRFGKKKIAGVLAEVLYGSQEQMICVDLNSQDGIVHSDTIFGCQVLNGYDPKYRGKTVVDYVAGELCKKPLSVVFLENVDKADVVAQNSLSQAILTGKFSDSHGRQVAISNTVFITTSKLSKGCCTFTSTNGSSNYLEEKILQAKGWPVQITVECAFEGSSISQNWRSSSHTTKAGISNQHFLNKRKLHCANEPLEQPGVSEMTKRANKMSTGYLDLNLPAEDNSPQLDDDEASENDCLSGNSKPWLQEFSDQVDETVVFKPVDFDALAEKISNEISNCFRKSLGSECLLQFNTEVIEQLLATVYLSDKYKAVEDWIEQELTGAFAEVQKRYSLNAHTTVKLKACQGICLEESAPQKYLPPRIIVK